MQLLQAKKLATDLMLDNGLDDWSFDFDQAIKRFGATYWGSKRITLSKRLVLLNNRDEVEQTILHEIAHALAGRYAGHGKPWKDIVVSIGGRAETYYDINKVVQVPPKYELLCKNCGYTSYANRKRRAGVACPLCCNKYNHGKYSSKFRVSYKLNNYRERLEYA